MGLFAKAWKEWKIAFVEQRLAEDTRARFKAADKLRKAFNAMQENIDDSKWDDEDNRAWTNYLRIDEILGRD